MNFKKIRFQTGPHTFANKIITENIIILNICIAINAFPITMPVQFVMLTSELT